MYLRQAVRASLRRILGKMLYSSGPRDRGRIASMQRLFRIANLVTSPSQRKTYIFRSGLCVISVKFA